MNTNMLFIEISELKSKLGITGKLDIVINPNTKLLFAAHGTTVRLKVEQKLDPNKPIKYMYEADTVDANGNKVSHFNEGCIVNVKPSNPPKFSL